MRTLDGADGVNSMERGGPARLNDGLFGAIAGATLDVGRFEVCPGLTLRPSYAHVMSPYILAFARPTPPQAFHPGPWKAARGGASIDVEVEASLEAGTRPTDFDRLNTLWWLVALLRLRTGARLRMPIVSDTSLSRTATSTGEPAIWPVETSPQQFATSAQPPRTIEGDSLAWLHTHVRLGRGADEG